MNTASSLPFLLALLIGMVAGLRAMTAPAAVSWGARVRLAAAFRSDRPAALLEVAVALGGALLVLLASR